MVDFDHSVPVPAKYSPEDVQRILALAMNQDAVSRSHLEEMAQELSIEDEDLRHAIAQWHGEKAALEQKRQRRQTFYRQALLPYLVVNTFLILLNVSISGAITWSIYPLLGWGAGLVLLPGGCTHSNKRSSTQVASSC